MDTQKGGPKSRSTRSWGHVGTRNQFDGYLLREILQGEEEERRLRCVLRRLRCLRWDSLNIDEISTRFEKAIWVKLSIRIVAPTLSKQATMEGVVVHLLVVISPS